jgi:prepilin-type N-terminal cleavage/methylation domain-containing protein
MITCQEVRRRGVTLVEIVLVLVITAALVMGHWGGVGNDANAL